MLRTATYITRQRVLDPRYAIIVQFPRKLRASRILNVEECDCDPTKPPVCPQPCEGGSMMDLLPIPDCPWKPNHDRINKQHTQALMIGAGFLLFTTLVLSRIGWVHGHDVALLS